MAAGRMKAVVAGVVQAAQEMQSAEVEELCRRACAKMGEEWGASFQSEAALVLMELPERKRQTEAPDASCS